MFSIKYYLKLVALPLILLITLSLLRVLWELFSFPDPEEIFSKIQVWFDTYGLPAVFLSAIVEGMLLVGGYYPGVFVIFLGVVLAGGISEAALVVVVVTAGLFLAHLFNYVLGRYGWYVLLMRFGMEEAVSRAQKRLLKKGPIAIFLSYWMPSIGAIADTAAGIIHMPFRTFLKFSFLSVVAWDIFWGVLVYILGELALTITVPGGNVGLFFMIGIFVTWMIIIIVLDAIERQENSAKEHVNDLTK
jgi:membrane protein DedA with SNARE-associated domain